MKNMTRVNAQLRAGTRATLTARHFSWRADEPPAAGGTDEGPTPYEILAGALAACVSITLRLYADHKGIPLQGVDVAVDFDRVHAEDCLECDNPEGGMIERIKTDVTLHGTFDAAQRARLAQVAERCPVHKSLTKGLQIFDSVSFEA
jgi:putative redox protein